jgi:hypothetical protein
MQRQPLEAKFINFIKPLLCSVSEIRLLLCRFIADFKSSFHKTTAKLPIPAPKLHLKESEEVK